MQAFIHNSFNFSVANLLAVELHFVLLDIIFHFLWKTLNVMVNLSILISIFLTYNMGHYCNAVV